MEYKEQYFRYSAPSLEISHWHSPFSFYAPHHEQQLAGGNLPLANDRTEAGCVTAWAQGPAAAPGGTAGSENLFVSAKHEIEFGYRGLALCAIYIYIYIYIILRSATLRSAGSWGVGAVGALIKADDGDRSS